MSISPQQIDIAVQAGLPLLESYCGVLCSLGYYVFDFVMVLYGLVQQPYKPSLAVSVLITEIKDHFFT